MNITGRFDENFKQGKPSGDASKKAILDDLKAFKSEVKQAGFERYAESAADVLEWLKINSIPLTL